MIVVTSWDCDGLGLIVLVAKITAMCSLDWSLGAMWCTTLLCWAMRRPLMCGWVQVKSRCGFVSIPWVGQIVQLGLGYVIGRKIIFFGEFSMQWAYYNSKVCVLCA